MSFSGLKTLYTYDNHPHPEKNPISCGQAAIATLYDFYKVVPYPLQRYKPGPDGILHYDYKLVDALFTDFPPSGIPPFNLFGLKFTVRETILSALQQRGIKAQEGYAAAFGNGIYERDALINWITKYKMPVMVLMDLHDLQKALGSSQVPNWYTLHWGFIYGVSKDAVQFASWGEVRNLPWNAFMASWHCKGLPYPNNFYAIYTHR